MTTPWLHTTADGVSIDLHVVPRASRTAVQGEHDGRLRVAVAAPPVDGEANDEIVRHFAHVLHVPKRDIEIAAGATGKRKRLVVHGISADAALPLLTPGAP